MKNKKKIGRRTINVSDRIKHMNVRLTLEEYIMIKERAKSANMFLSDYVREIALSRKFKARLSEEERMILRDLIAMANDLHLLARLAEHAGLLKVVMHFETYRNKIDNLINKIEHD